MMKRILRRGSLLMLPVLVLGGVGFGLASAPAAHAGPVGPSVTAYFESAGSGPQHHAPSGTIQISITERTCCLPR
jgi:hypothetical protein